MTLPSDRRAPALEDEIEEAALDGKQWPQALLGIADLALASNAYLVLATDTDARVVAAGRTDEATVGLPGLLGLLRDQANTGHFTRLGPAEPGSLLTALVVPIADGHKAALVLRTQGEIATSRVARLNGLAPLLSRTILVGAKVAESHPAAAVNSLGGIGYAASVMTRSARMVKSNELFVEWLASAPASASRQLTLIDTNANAAWLRALEICVDTGTQVVVPTRTQHWDSVLHLVPMEQGDEPLLAPVHALAIVTPPVGGRIRPAVIEELFDFTPSEAAIAFRLVGGQTLEEIANATSRSILTVRTQAKKLLAKAGVRRQAEFVGMMTRLLPGL